MNSEIFNLLCWRQGSVVEAQATVKTLTSPLTRANFCVPTKSNQRKGCVWGVKACPFSLIPQKNYYNTDY